MFEVNPARAPGLGLPGGAGPPAERPATGEAAARRSALERWATNPEVDHLIGRKLSQKYRFAEGRRCSEASRSSCDPDYQPAKSSSARTCCGWATRTRAGSSPPRSSPSDGYNVVAYNLVTLRDRLAGFRTLEGGRVPRADGPARGRPLRRTRPGTCCGGRGRRSCEKYGSTLAGPGDRRDLSAAEGIRRADVRPPGADGLLGVCFGRVVTANSPASQGEHPSNWEAVLWHEFCHVVTLSKTHNKMPRWLSEGISVYEEERQDPAWGTRVEPEFRAMILGDELHAVEPAQLGIPGRQDRAPPQFAYFESALAVEFLVERFGLPGLEGRAG